ncbi:MAG: hypothetical protein K9G76_06730 [Bacteroidales bacterium]|nr:hypothetical protein [Bacteroidales bacterium]MCF8404328.1 hypothetical protein [Bacteroidales bacterium]
MKKLMLVGFILLSILPCLFSQYCLPEGITFSTQAQIDSFQVNYPGCTAILGDVIIEGADITNLQGLEFVESMQSNVWIQNCLSLKNFQGLNNLLMISGQFEILYNDSLTSLSGLDKIHFIGHSLIFVYDHALTDITSLSSLEMMDDGVIGIWYNDAIANISGLDNIDPNTISLIDFHGNPSLSECAASTVCGYIQSYSASFYNNAPGCNSIYEVEEACEVYCHPGGILFTSQAQLDTFQINYPECITIQGSVEINGADITSLAPLSNIQVIKGDLTLLHNYNLTSLSGLENLTTIEGSLNLGLDEWPVGNPILSDITALQNLSSVGYSLKVVNHPTLTDLSGLENITSLPGDLIIYYNQNLQSLNGLNNLSELGNIFWVYLNASLKNFEGLNNLSTVNDYFWVVANDSLTSLSGLENVSIDPTAQLHIHSNPQLSICNIESICEYLIPPNGEIYIYDNAEGCNSQGQIEEACFDSCLPEGITFNTQAQIDNFKANYPGCTEIEGGVLVEGTDITNLDSLHNITLIGGYL